MYKRSSETVRNADAGEETLAGLHSAFTTNRRSRPPTISIYGAVEGERRIPLSKNIQKRSSKFGLHGMFNRAKASKITVDIVAPVRETLISKPQEFPELSTFQNPRPAPSPITPRKEVPSSQPVVKPSLLNMGSKSVKLNNSVTRANTKAKTPNKTDSHTSAIWDPPPLFKAYPQSIKHATLAATTLSADAILRMSNQNRSSSVVDELTYAPVKQAERVKMKHRRRMSGSLCKADWTQKIFILVTSGYLLQYAGTGSFDRLPEKIMRLGKDSVAFASDVIPGKHWVLQISQSMDIDGTPASDSRSLLSRLSFKGADYRRTATSLLLVFNSAEDLDSWIAVVRREIEALGGKKGVTEIGTPKVEETVPDLKSQPSHRYLIPRKPELISETSPSQSSVFVPPWTHEHSNSERSVDAVMKEPHSPFIRPSTGHHSMTTISSHECHHLDSRRNSSNRLSYMSSSQRTYPTSRSTSPANSPTRDSFSAMDDYPGKYSSQEDVRPRPNALAINERRRSMQVMQNPVFDSSAKYRPHSTYDMPSQKANQHSSTPNFSVPNSSNRRYSFARNPTVVSNSRTTGKDSCSVSISLATLPLRSRESSVTKAPRKLPSSFHRNSTRPLSPVKDATSPRKVVRAPIAAPSNRSSFGTFAQKHTLPVSNPPGLSASQAPISEANTGRRISVPLLEPSLPSLQFPPHFSNMQGSHNALEPTTKRINAIYLPPELTTSLPLSPFTPSADYLSQQQDLALMFADAERQSGLIPASPNATNAAANSGLRRPTSLAFLRSEPDFASRRKNSLPSMLPEKTTYPKAASTASFSSNSVHDLCLQSSSQNLSKRQSLQTLTDGPPPAPPPSCALPPLPSPEGVRIHRTSIRHSVKA